MTPESSRGIIKCAVRHFLCMNSIVRKSKRWGGDAGFWSRSIFAFPPWNVSCIVTMVAASGIQCVGHACSWMLSPTTSPGKTPDLIRMLQPPAVAHVKSLPNCLILFIHKFHGGQPCEYFILSLPSKAWVNTLLPLEFTPFLCFVCSGRRITIYLSFQCL